MAPEVDAVFNEKMDLTPEALTILENRYLLRDKTGKIIETPEQMCLRLATEAARAGGGDEESQDNKIKRFYQLLARSLFSPNSPTWMNAGTENSQNAACFVLPVEDALPKIFDAVKGAALIHQSGGGTGFDFSTLRPKGDVVRSTGGVASGPVSFMAVFNAATETIKQGGKRRGANIGILRVDHPDIEAFVTCKEDNAALTNFNVSVGITDKFMQAVIDDTEYELINPRNNQVAATRRARDVFDLIVGHAWKNGEPGVVFLDTIERSNPTPALGRISATNPCGEQPLLPYEACHLGSINLQQMYREQAYTGSELEVVLELAGDDTWSGRDLAGVCRENVPEIANIHWELLKDTTWGAVDFLDSIIDVSEYPLPEITEMVRRTRKIGLGFMGLADLFIKLRVNYASEKAELLAELISRFITHQARLASQALAKERGAFPAWPDSVFARTGGPELRNATVTTVAPTGTISMVANASSGCEPLFGVAFTKQNVLGDKQLTQVNTLFIEDATKRGIYSEDLMRRIAENGGSVRGIPGIPDDMVELYRTALEIPWEWHVRIQAAVQRGIDNAVSKTINLPNEATPDEVKSAFLLAHRLGCKGITVYRSGSRELEVISSKAKPQVAAQEEAEEKPTPRGRKPYTIDCTLWGRLQPIDRPETLNGITKRIATPSGTLWATLNLYEGRPFEMFCQIGRAGTDIYAFTESIARLISLALRAGVDPSEVVRQLRGIGGSGQIGFGPNRVLSVPDAIGRMLDQVSTTRYAGDEWFSPERANNNRPGSGSSLVAEAGATAAEADAGQPTQEGALDDAVQPPLIPVEWAEAGNGAREGACAGATDEQPCAHGLDGEDGYSGAGNRLSNGHSHVHGTITRHDLCPQCGNYSLIYASGCSECRLCGYSAC